MRTVWLGLCMAAAALAQSKPFSHALHLKLKPECASCHVATAVSTAVSDNNLPGQIACRGCHKQDMPIKEPSKLLVTKFSHALHVGMGSPAAVIAAAIDGKTYLSPEKAALVRPHLSASGSACVACHRGMAESVAVSRENMPQMADCLVCHPKIDAPFSCEKCHDAGKHLIPASHTRVFVDGHSSGKMNFDKQSCVVCHGKKFTCLGCH